MHSFKECPHVLMELSLVSEPELAQLSTGMQEQAMNPDESDLKIRQAFRGLDNAASFVVMDDPTQLYSYKSDKGKEWERIHRSDFTVDVKRGLYFEIFYSPYFDEVLQLAVVQRSSDGNELS